MIRSRFSWTIAVRAFIFACRLSMKICQVKRLIGKEQPVPRASRHWLPRSAGGLSGGMRTAGRPSVRILAGTLQSLPCELDPYPTQRLPAILMQTGTPSCPKLRVTARPP
jgi:hypothetical protein